MRNMSSQTIVAPDETLSVFVLKLAIDIFFSLLHYDIHEPI